MRILILIHEFPPVGGGGGRAAYDIAKELTSRGHEITVLTAHLKGLPKDELVDGIRILRLPSLRKQASHVSFLAMGLFILAALSTGVRVIRRWHPVLIHVHFAVPAGAAAWILSRLTRIPYVLTTHLGDVPGGVPEKTGRWFQWVFPFTRPIWRGAARIVAVCEYTRSLARQHYDVNPVVIPNGINMKILNSGRFRIHQPPVIIFAGRFTLQKNLVEMVKILALVQDLPWKCIMLGDGPLFEDVKRTITAYGLDQRFYLPGWVTPDQVLAFLGQSDLLFMPSLSEGLSVVGVQGLAKGLAIIASRAGGSVELVEVGRNGFLADSGDRDALCGALRSFLSNHKALLNARRASRVLARRFDIKTVVDGYETIFCETIS